MRVWIDLANSPQVLFFRPIVTELRRRGHDVLITTRDFAQTLPLADRYGFQHTPLGGHGGRSWFKIIFRNLSRSLLLAQWARRHAPIHVAVSHNSYSLALATVLVRMPFVTLMDYEHHPFNWLCFRLAHRVIVPDPFPNEFLFRFGALSKSMKYPGVKEQIYLSDFSPESSYLERHAIPAKKVVAVVRPPGPWAPYHRFENTLFDNVLSSLVAHEDVYIVFLPRIPAQAEAARRLGYPNLWIPPRTLDGPNLLYHADLVISGGGTMNREAAVLGTPAYTVFKGKLGAVDRYLIRQGRMVQISNERDIPRIRLEKRNGHVGSIQRPEIVQEVTDLILDGA